MIQFKEAADQIKQEGPRELTVRQLLGLFGQRRRGRHVMAQIRRALKRENLVTSPSFEAAHMDAPILLQPKITELRKEENMAELATSGRPVTSEDRKGIVQFKQVAEQIRQEGPKELTVRQLLALFGQQRRGRHVAAQIRKALKQEKLETVPSFEVVYMDAPFVLRSKTDEALKEEKRLGTASGAVSVAMEEREVVLTIGQLEQANRAPLRVTRNDTVTKAVTLMMQNDIAYLAVMSGERTVDGILSWRTIGKARAAKRPADTVQHYLAKVRIVEIETPLFDAVRDIVEGEAVLVRSKGTICGLVSARDIASQFVTLSEPFLFLEQIENHLRAILERARLSSSAVKELVNPADADRIDKVNSVDDLSFGETARAFGREEIWDKLHLLLDRSAFCIRLEEVRSIRNKVMHFHPDGILDEERDILRKTRQMLQSL